MVVIIGLDGPVLSSEIHAANVAFASRRSCMQDIWGRTNSRRHKISPYRTSLAQPRDDRGGSETRLRKIPVGKWDDDHQRLGLLQDAAQIEVRGVISESSGYLCIVIAIEGEAFYGWESWWWLRHVWHCQTLTSLHGRPGAASLLQPGTSSGRPRKLQALPDMTWRAPRERQYLGTCTPGLGLRLATVFGSREML